MGKNRQIIRPVNWGGRQDGALLLCWLAASGAPLLTVLADPIQQGPLETNVGTFLF